jgi:hypothetical protein
MCAAAIAGCGLATHAAPQESSAPVPRAASSTACTRAARAELVDIARRIYAQAAGGRNTAAATRRVQRSRALALAVAARDPAATRAALRPLIKHQITRIEITAGHRTLARYGTTPAYGPSSGTLRLGGRPVGRYVLAVSRRRDFSGLVRELTGATAAFHSAAAPAAGPVLPATLFPHGRAVLTLTLPSAPAGVCGPTAADTRAAVAGTVATRLLDAETRGAGARRAIRMAERNPAFRAAVASGDPRALRAAIIGFFRDKRFHIVRVRAWNRAGLIGDVGGPYVLSPVTGTVHGRGGAVAGRFMLSIQDDTGFIKLMHRFTGTQVTLRAPQGVVPGSDLPAGTPFATGLHAVTASGRAWRAVGLRGTVFPGGPLDITLWLPAAG